MSFEALTELVGSFTRTAWQSRAHLSRDHFLVQRDHALRRWLEFDLPKVAAFQGLPASLLDLPVMDKATLMADFAAYNRAGITAEAVRRALQTDCLIDGLTVGASTGTSGNRGYFVVSDAERYRWLGAILAKTMRGLLTRPQRVAIILPQDTRLYSSATSVPWLALRFFPSGGGLYRWRKELEAFNPSVIVASPRMLRLLVEEEVRLKPSRVFSAGETLDPVDRPIIESGLGCSLGQIYMATEGLLGVTCGAGRLHLAEESIFFEFEDVGAGLVSPIITSFRRQVQIMARYRMNDLLRLGSDPCPCGMPQQTVEEVVGRVDDCFHVAGKLVTPDIPRNAVVGAHPSITDYRVIQEPDGNIHLVLPNTLPTEVALVAQSALESAFLRCGAPADVKLRQEVIKPPSDRKLRRIERRVAVRQA